jgi:hypothetical protein
MSVLSMHATVSLSLSLLSILYLFFVCRVSVCAVLCLYLRI